MFHQLTADVLNGSCDYTMPTCNNSTDEAALQLPTFSMAAKVRVIITFTLCAVSAVCNLSVLWAASTNNKRKSHVRILIMNLTVADLLVTFIVMPVDAAWKHHGSVVGRGSGLQIANVSEACGDVLLCVCDCGHKPGQAVGHSQPSGHQ